MKRAAALLLPLALAGCVSPMVKSQVANTKAPAAARLLGEYGLAQSVFTVTVSAPASADKDDDKTPSVVVTNTINAAAPVDKPAAAAKATEPAKPPESETAWCADLRKSYAQDRLATLAFAQKRNLFLSKLGAWSGQGTYTSAERTQILKGVDDYFAAKRAIDEVVERAKRNVQLMGVNRDGVTDDGRDPVCVQRFKVDIKETVEIDAAKVYRLYALTNDASADHWTAEFDGGLPKAISGTADHQGGEILAAGVKSIASIQALGLGPSLPTFGVSGKDADALVAALKALRAKPLTPEKLNDLKIALEAAKPQVLAPIDITLPVHKVYTVADFSEGVLIVHDALPVALRADCSPAPDLLSGDDPGDGIAVSASRACQLTILSRADYEAAKALDAVGRVAFKPAQASLARVKVWALDSSRVATLPLDRTTLIKTTTAYTFTAGRASKVDFDRPAPALQVVSLPFKLIGAAVGGFVDTAKGETSKVQARTDLTKANTAELEAAAALAKVRKDQADAAKAAATPTP